MLIIEKVYKRHQKLWDGCYAMIFGEENAEKFNTQKGMADWNRKLYQENRNFMELRVRELLQQNIDSVLAESLKGFTTIIDKHKPKAKISIVFAPLQGLSIGGCDQYMFALDLMDTEHDLSRVVTEGLPHEINHLAYEPTRVNDPDRYTALLNTIDEGLSCYYTYKYFDGELTRNRAVENMTEDEWAWYMQHEKEIFTKAKPYLFVSSETQTPYSCSCGMHRGEKLFEDAPKTICYWLGFRIIEFYEKNNGAGSWKEVYELPVRDVLVKSGYEAYINSL
ncbi:DUF2268 domain-containing putative Zn-dependent protease [Pontibacter rugosus]|uniref:DUF2268 domain-containing putative Zn-dependent protease n=1 Tax=Pontibacter rugosus TaxID=1745966 RepID=A0ABW3SU76_9BACT